MWIATPTGYVSIVYQPEWCAPTELVVRARARADLEGMFGLDPDQVIVTGQADYPYRANLDRDLVATRVARLLLELDYGNMKGAVDHDDRPRHDAYMGCWRSLLALEDRAARVRRTWPDLEPTL